MSVFAAQSKVLLDPASSKVALLDAVKALRDEFSRITGVDELSEEPADCAATMLRTGTAIAPRDAARCLLDFARTAAFLRGVRAAIEEAQRRFPGTRIEVLYAGCGPWAPLLLPLGTAFDSRSVGFRLLDIHQRSLEAARSLADRCGLHSFLIDCVHADATTVQLERAPHVIVAETMRRALSGEPQLALTANLAPQLIQGGIFVPEHVRVELWAADCDVESGALPASESEEPVKDARIRIGRLMDLAPARATSILATARDGLLPRERFFVPPLPGDRDWEALILTEVVVWGDIALGAYDSGVTYPEILSDLGRLRGGECLEVRYRFGCHPGFEVRASRPPRIRDATAADRVAMLALNLESEAWLSPMDGNQIARMAECSALQRVIEVDGEVVGFLLALPAGAGCEDPDYRWFDDSRDHFLYVDRIVVGEEHRGRGLASALYDDLFSVARNSGIEEIAGCFEDTPPNPAARGFHASYGFSEVGTRTRADGSGVSLQVARLRPR